MKRKLSFLSFVVAVGVCVLLAGCGQSGSKGSETSATAQPERPTTPGIAGKSESEAAPARPLSEIPASLKHDAYEYFGLGNPQPLTYQITSTAPGAQPVTGTQTVRFTGMENGEARFSITRTDGMASLGDAEMAVTDKGVEMIRSSVGDMGGRKLELPRGLSVGKSWKDKSSFDAQGRKMSMEGTYKVAKMETVETPAGKFDALKIEANAKVTLDGQKGTMKMDSWWVKGLGSVKITVENTMAGGTKNAVTIVLTKKP
jgi:hypothetical protein